MSVSSTTNNNMDSLLLCDEIMTPDKAINLCENVECRDIDKSAVSFCREDCEETFRMLMEKEESFMPKSGYLNLLKSNNFIRNARTESVGWLIKTQGRFNLSSATVFGAINYMDRYISSTKCEVWKYGMFELLSIACLSVASKFNQMNSPSLHEFQVDKLDDSFSATVIQKMELTLLESLGWRMDCVTPFSYMELLLQTIDVNQAQVVDLNSRATELLLNVVSGANVVEFRPSVIAISVVKCVLEDSPSQPGISKCLSTIIPPNHKEDLIKCQKSVRDLFAARHQNHVATCESSLAGPSSPVTVLYNYHGGGNTSMSSSRKRKRDQLEYF